MKTTTIVTDELYALLASELWWKIRDRSYTTLSPTNSLEADSESLYATLYGTFHMEWRPTTDIDGTTFLRLHDISGEQVELFTAQNGEKTRNNFRWETLRDWLLDCYGY